MGSKGNNYAFIDSQNVNLAIRDSGWQLDFARFRKYLKDKFRITKAFLFIGFVAENESLYTSLQEAGYILVFKPTLLLPSGKAKGNVDAELVIPNRRKYSSLYRKFMSDIVFMNDLKPKLAYSKKKR